MAYAFFKIPSDGGKVADELNAFLRTHRVMDVRRKWSDAGDGSFWAFSVEYLETESDRSAFRAGKIDYREVLSPEDFSIFSKLREVRKTLSERDGVPVFAVLSNEQLAEIARRKCQTEEALEQITGIGKTKVEKFGGAILEAMKSFAAVENGS